MTDTFSEQMERELGSLGISLTEEQLNQFYQYYEMLVEKNKVMNLTAITKEDEVVTKHFSDSLSLLKALGDKEKGALQSGVRLIDVGTGAGFPGIPLKIAFPQIKLTLLDSLNKRIKFLQEVCESLDLSDVTFVHGRAEDTGRMKEHREQYDFCVSRAVANLSSLSEYCMPFVKVGGYFIPYKSGEAQDEIRQAERAVGILGGRIEENITFTLPGSDFSRCLVRIRKEKAISGRYPRKAGTPSKEPL